MIRLMGAIVLACILLPLGAVQAQTPTPAPSISDNLSGCWTMDELSGTRFDYLGATHLTDNNTVQATSGRLGNAAFIDGANDEFLSNASPTFIQLTGESFTWVLWISPAVDVGARTAYVLKQSSTGGVVYFIGRDGSSEGIWFDIPFAGTAYVDIMPYTNVWYMITARYDSVAGTMALGLDNEPYEAGGGASWPHIDTGPLTIGRPTETNSIRIDNVVFWKRAITDADRTWLWNNGNGRSCAEIAPQAAPTPTPSIQRSINLSSGDTAIIDRSLSYGDVAIMGMIGLLLVGLIIMGTISISERLYK
jgi:hypothetical protein